MKRGLWTEQPKQILIQARIEPKTPSTRDIRALLRVPKSASRAYSSRPAFWNIWCSAVSTRYLHNSEKLALIYVHNTILMKLSDRNGVTWRKQPEQVIKPVSEWILAKSRGPSCVAFPGPDRHQSNRWRCGNYKPPSEFQASLQSCHDIRSPWKPP